MAEDIIGLIPAAGKGLRLRLPYPKELYPIIRDNRYKPVSQYVVENLISSGVNHIVFVVNETKHQLIGYFGDGHRFGCNFSYVVQESNDDVAASTSPGLAYALDASYHLIRGKTVCFGMADTVMQPSEIFVRAIKVARPDDDVVLVLFKTGRPEQFGMVRMDRDQRVIEIVDKPKTTDLELMWGCILWRPAFTEHLHSCVTKDGITDFAQVMNDAIKKGMRFQGFYLPDGIYSDLGTYEEIVELEKKHGSLSQE